MNKVHLSGNIHVIRIQGQANDYVRLAQTEPVSGNESYATYPDNTPVVVTEAFEVTYLAAVELDFNMSACVISNTGQEYYECITYKF